MPEHDLASLQHWMQDIITSEAWSVEEALAASSDQHGIRCGAAIVGSKLLPAAQRLDIYARSYRLRLIECLHAEFPLLRQLVGDQVFHLFAGAYLGARPPTSYTLFDLGAGFADHLEATRPQPHDGRGTLEALPASLARLERALAESERAAGIETEAGATPPVELLFVYAGNLQTPASLRLLRLDFDFADMLAAARIGHDLAVPEARDCLIAIARSRYRVRMHTLEPWQLAWLNAISTTGCTRQRASQIAADETEMRPEEINGRLLAWLPYALEVGMVMAAPPVAPENTDSAQNNHNVECR